MAEAVRKSTRNKVFPKRYIGWYGLRMLTASRDRNAGLQPAGPLSTAESANEKLDHRHSGQSQHFAAHFDSYRQCASD